jgi:hypothetical protein
MHGGGLITLFRGNDAIPKQLLATFQIRCRFVQSRFGTGELGSRLFYGRFFFLETRPGAFIFKPGGSFRLGKLTP